MDNFEARYRAIVEKEPGLACPDLATDELNQWFYKTSSHFVIPSPIARPAVCWWLAGKLQEQDLASLIVVWCQDDPADAILTAWEIILGIKEKA